MRGDPRIRLDLYVAGLGGEPELVLKGDDNDPEHSGRPIWSPDGSTIYISADRRQRMGTAIWAVDLDSKRAQRISPNDGRSFTVDLDPAVSPDGTRIVFASNRHATSQSAADDFDLYTMRTDGSGLARLTEDPGTVRQPSFSPDGQRIFFASTRIRSAEYEWEIYAMRAAGGVQKRLTRDLHPQNTSPSAFLRARDK
jgi:Tol biopolymer transport system component